MLNVQNIHAGYHGVEVLHGVSLTIHEGEVISLVGLNGAGKSTMMKVLSGMLKTNMGVMSFDEHDITKKATDELVKKGIVHVPENRMLFPPLTVGDNLLLGTASKGAKYRKEKYTEQLNFVFELFPVLKERVQQRAGTLSGGEQQMLAIGRGLMASPRLLLLDEPSLGLAPLVVEKIFDVIQRLNKLGITILLVEQNVSRALEICNRGYVLDLGRIILSGTGKELLVDSRIQQIYLGEMNL